jgi:hypothetical protein
MKIFMDDARETPDGFIRTYSIEETIELLKTRQVEFLSLDNDLGSEDPKTEGFNVLNWIEEAVYHDNTFPIPQMTVHSSNAGRAPSMRKIIEKLEMIRQSQIGGN